MIFCGSRDGNLTRIFCLADSCSIHLSYPAIKRLNPTAATAPQTKRSGILFFLHTSLYHRRTSSASRFLIQSTAMPTSKRRRPRKSFPFRVQGYLDADTFKKVMKAAEACEENISQFCARALIDRADKVLAAK